MTCKKLIIRSLIALSCLLTVSGATLFSQTNNFEKNSEPNAEQKFIEINVESNSQRPVDRQFSVDQWLEDLDFVLSKLKEKHPNIYYRISSEDLSNTIETARLAIKQSDTDAECFIAIRKVVASIQDGHTSLGYSDAVNLLVNKLPVKIDYFRDGFFISAVDQRNKELLGLKVTAIDGMPIEEAMQRAMAITCMDNKFGRQNRARGVLRYPILLKGLGISNNENQTKFTLINSAGSPIEHLFSSVKDYNDNDLFTVQSTLQNDLPLHLKNPNRNYWFEQLTRDKVLYAQLNAIDDQNDGKTETFSSFTENLWNYIDNHATEIDKVIIDLRYNPGGNGRMAIPFIKEIIKRDRINSRGKLFVLIGKETYSAAVVMATELLQYTEATFVGDPPGCPSNLFSNSRAVGNLPNTGCSFSVATRLIDNAWTTNREYFLPDVPAQFSSQDFFSGIDPALDVILSDEALPIDVIATERGTDKALSVFSKISEKYPDIPGWESMVEARINVSGYNFLKESYFAKADSVKVSNYSKAEALLILNTVLFPQSSNAFESLGEAYFVNGQKELALKNFKKSLELDPENAQAKKMIKRVSS